VDGLLRLRLDELRRRPLEFVSAVFNRHALDLFIGKGFQARPVGSAWTGCLLAEERSNEPPLLALFVCGWRGAPR
jgi:hypothetical protein